MINIVTIDGPASSGKTSMGYKFSKMINFNFIDSGSIYRAGTLAILRERVNFNDDDANAQIFRSMDLRFESSDEGQIIMLGDENITLFLDSMEITQAVPFVASTPLVRQAVRDIQRRLAAVESTVVTGRDIGTVVFPDAHLKIFITATPEARTQRRFLQLQNEGEFITYEFILEDIKKRDEMDKNRSESPFKIPEGAVILDTSTIDMEQTLAELLKIYQAHTW